MSPARLPSNLAASERARLANLGRQRRLEFQLVLSDFAIERLLYRLSVSRHADRFVLKGARLFRIWSEDRRRATWDLDLLGRGANGSQDVVADLREICAIPAADGIVFGVGSIRGEPIRAADEYAGVRVRFEATLDGARIPMQVDVGFGDAVTPTPRRETYPTLLDHDPPTILAYPREAVVAEKVEAMVSLGVTNSRVKDFHDVHTLASSFAFDGALLAAAIRATFGRRGTTLPEEEPLVLSAAFLSAPERQTLWRAFLRRHRLDGPADAAALSDGLRLFLGPVLASARGQTAFQGTWPPGGPWQ